MAYRRPPLFSVAPAIALLPSSGDAEPVFISAKALTADLLV
jgi:hypothetical protein